MNYGEHKKGLSEENRERFLIIINLCKKQLETTRVWVELSDEFQEEEPIEIKLTNVRREFEKIYEECGTYNSRCERILELIKLCKKYTEETTQKY